MIGGPKGAPSHPQELEVGGCRPPYLLVLHTNIRSKKYLKQTQHSEFEFYNYKYIFLSKKKPILKSYKNKKHV